MTAISKCPHCGQPFPMSGTLHTEDCPDHDEVTCLACKEIEHGDGEVQVEEDLRSAEEVWRSSAEKWEANCKEADALIVELQIHSKARNATYGLLVKACDSYKVKIERLQRDEVHNENAGMEKAARIADGLADEWDVPPQQVAAAIRAAKKEVRNE